MTDALTLRRLATHAEYEACVRLQELTWGAGFHERVPTSLLHVAHEIGGVVAGAFQPDGTLAAFVFGLTGVRDGRLVHWSDMLAVRPELRDRGIGRRLKHFQRDLVRSLGARVVAYVEDLYGTDTGSPLHAGLGTDRLIVAWDVVPNTDAAVSPAAGAEVEIPPDVHALLARDPAAAVAWRHATREALGARLAAGWQVAGFRGGRDAARPCYLLSPPPPAPER